MTIRSLRELILGTVIGAITLAIPAMAIGQMKAHNTDDPGQPVADEQTAAYEMTATDKGGMGKFWGTKKTDTKKELWRDEDTPLPKQANAPDRKWHFAFAPYLYLTGVSGTVGARNRTSDIHLSIGDVLSHFNGGLMGSFAARRGRLVIFNDLLWTKLTEERSTPRGLYDTGKITVNMTVINPMGGVRVVQSDRGSIELTAGVRITSVKTSLLFTSGILPGFNVEGRKTWAAPVVGAHGLVNLSPRFYLSTLFDVGGGFGTHFTGQFDGGAGFRLTRRVALIGGYRYLKNDYSDDNGFVFDTAMNGILMGAKFSF